MERGREREKEGRDERKKKREKGTIHGLYNASQ